MTRILSTFLFVVLTGCVRSQKTVITTPLDEHTLRAEPVQVALAPDAKISGVTAGEVRFVLNTLAKYTNCRASGPIIHVGKSELGEEMIAHTDFEIFRFSRTMTGKWRLVSCGPYIRDP